MVNLPSTHDVSREIVVVGAGGHAKVVIDLLFTGGWTVIGCTSFRSDDNPPLGVRMLGEDTVLPGLLANGVRFACVAIGDNRARDRACRALRQQGFALPAIIGSAAIVSRFARIGAGTVVLPGAIVCADTHIGEYAIINTRASVDHDAIIEGGAHIGPGATLAGNVRIGRRTQVGAGSTIAPGVAVGEDSVIGAGSCVVRDIADRVTAYGNPARARS